MTETIPNWAARRGFRFGIFRLMKNRIRELRERAGLSQAQLAELVGTTQAQIARLEKGERRLTVDWMARIARALMLRPSDLLPNAAVADVDAKEVELLANFRAMSEPGRTTLIDLSRLLADRAAPARPKRGAAAPAGLREPSAQPLRRPRLLHDVSVPLLPPVPAD
jgi:transcriptional regulator with XRE-family HTH domain